ncbi:hypothetical protein BGZ76_004378 [Entomortierella beljakovae]|nr:hypothetical protein BGZ76_004378 [Entomortierella beljakovae]
MAARGSQAQPQSLSQRLSRSSRASLTPGPQNTVESESDDQDRTPRPQHQTIGAPRTSSDTLRAKKIDNSSNTSTPHTTTSTTFSSGSSSTAISNGKSDTKQKNGLEMTDASLSSKFSLGSKKKRQQREEQKREDRRLKEEANEALRRKHGEYLPPGHSQGQIHTHRSQPHHDHHKLERQRSSGSVRFQYHQKQRSQSSVRIVSPTPMTALSPSSPVSPSPSPAPSSSSSMYSSHRSSSGGSRPMSPLFGMTPILIDQMRDQSSAADLHDLDAESIVSEQWSNGSDTGSNSEDDNHRSHSRSSRRSGSRSRSNGHGRKKDHHRNASVDTNSSFRTNNSSMVHFDLRPLSPYSPEPSRRPRSRTSKNHILAMSMDMQNDQHPERPEDAEMRELNRHRSWQLNNRSTTGIVTGLSPEIDDPPPRPQTSMSVSRYHARSKSRDNIHDRYLTSSRSYSPAHSNVPSSGSHHRSNGLYPLHHYESHGGLNELNASALEALRSKAGSRAAGTIHGDTTIAGSAEESTFGNDHPTDEHNYLAPLPPFQQGPAYSKLPRRKYCRWFFGGCRWWVLLLLFLLFAGVAAAVAVMLVHKFKSCVAIDPTTVSPTVYTIDPSSVSSITLEYQTRTGGIINITESSNEKETRVLLKLQRQFHKKEDQTGKAGFQITNLVNGTVHYALNDMIDNGRGFFEPTVLCSNSILTIEMPKAVANRPELSFDVLVDQQDVFVNLDESVRRNSIWKIKGLGDHSLDIKSLNVNALSVSYTSTSPSTINLGSVIVRDQLSVMRVSGDIQASIGFSFPSAQSIPATVNLNTLDGNIQLDMKAWNQTCTFQAQAPSVQLSKSEHVVLPFGYHDSNGINTNGLTANTSSNGVSGMFTPGIKDGALPPTTSIATGTATTSKSSSTSTSTTSTTTAAPTPTVPVSPPGPTLGAGGSSLPVQIMIQANKYIILNFP